MRRSESSMIRKDSTCVGRAGGAVLAMLLMMVAGCTTPMQKAARNGDLRTLRELVDSGVDPSEDGALAWAVFGGHKDAAVYLLDNGASPDGVVAGHSMLFHAAFSSQWEMARLLIERGADAQSAADEFEAYWASFVSPQRMAPHKANAERLRRMGAAGTDAGARKASEPEKPPSETELPRVDSEPAAHPREGRSEQAPPKSNLAVLDLTAVGISPEESVILTNRLRSEVFGTNRFIVVERDRMNEILHEQGFQLSGCTSSECLVEAGQLLNVNRMIGGSVGRIGDIFTIELRLIDVETGKILAAATEDVDGEIGDVLKKGIAAAVSKLIQ
jgi:TolB-like protein